MKRLLPLLLLALATGCSTFSVAEPTGPFMPLAEAPIHLAKPSVVPLIAVNSNPAVWLDFDGGEVLFLVDSASSVSFIDPAGARDLGLEVRADDAAWTLEGANGKTTKIACSALLEHLQLGEVELKPIKLWVLDNDPRLSGKYRGILGQDALPQFTSVVGVDPRPGVRLNLDGREILFLVDSASEESFIEPARTRDLGLEVRDEEAAWTLTGSTGKTTTIDRWVPVEHLRLGELELEHVKLWILDDDDSMHLGEYGGILGQDVLSRLAFVVDMERRELHLVPPGSNVVNVPKYLVDLPEDRRPSPFAVAAGAFHPTLLHIDYDGRMPFTVVPIGAEHEELAMVFDTGAESAARSRCPPIAGTSRSAT